MSRSGSVNEKVARSAAKTAPPEQQLILPFEQRKPKPRSCGAEPLAVRIPDAVRMTGIGRSKLYLLIAAGDLETVKIGRCTLIPVESLKRLLAPGQLQKAVD